MLKRFSFIPLPLIIAIAVIIYIVDIRTIYEPHLLLPILNTIFTSGGGFIIALITASAYVFGAKRQALFLGGGSLALGISALLAGWIFPDSLNESVTIFSIGALLAAVLHILGSAQITEKYPARYSMKKFSRQSIAILFYSGIAIFFVILSVAAIRGLFPPFFVAGEGYTPIRWVIIIAYLILFFTSASLYARLYYFSKESFIYWYSLGLAIIAVGLTLAPLATPGSPLNWLGRIAQYLGSIYFLVAAVSALKEARAKGMGLAQKLSNIWREPVISYRMLVSMARDAIISIDDEGKVLVWSPAAERLFGYSQNEAIGSPFASLVVANKQADSLMIQLDHSNDINNDLADKNRVELELRKKNGETFTAELSVSIRDTPSGRLRMAVIRDITERKQAEKEIEHLASFPQLNPSPIIEIDANGTVIFSNAATADVLKTLKMENDVRIFLPGDFEEIMKALEQEKEGQLFYRNVEIKDRIFAESIHIIKKLSVVRIYMHDITERKRAEEALRDSEERFKAIAETTPIGIGVVGIPEANFLYVNTSYEKAFGYAEGELLGRKTPEIYWDQADRVRILKLLKENGNVADYEIRLKRKDGTLFWGISSVRPINFEGKAALLGVFTDITERKRAEEALRKAHDELELRVQERTTELEEANQALKAEIKERKQAEEELRRAKELSDALNNINTAINSTLDFDEIMQRVIVESAKAIGCETASIILSEGDYWVVRYIYGLPEELIGMRFIDEDVPHGALATKTKQPVVINDAYNDNRVNRQVMERYGVRSVLVIPLVMREKVIGNIYFNYHSAPIAFAPTQVDFAKKLAASTSLSIQNACLFEVRKHAEEKVREQADLLDKAQEAIGVRNLEHRLIYWNKGAQRLYGWTAEEAIGKNPVEFLFKDKEEPPQLIEAKRSVLERGEWTGELHQITKDGREVIVESHWTLICDSEGKPKSIFVVNTDNTEKKIFEAHLLRAQRMESIGILAGGIAHNLNNMLTPMMMSLQMLKQKFKDEQSQKLLNILEKNSQRSADLIKQVLSFSRGVEGERTPLQVEHIITEIEKIAKETFPRNIEIKTDIQRDLFTISGDATQLHQVIMNLCVNARDAMPDGGILSISAENFYVDESYARMHTEAKVGSYVVIAASDTGIGIPPKILDRIFEPFFTTKEFGKGTGLGLSTVLAIVKSHGGFINVYSEVGKGTTFRVYLPAIKTEMQNVEEQQLELLIGNGELVLVAEDEDSVREVTISTLEKYGYSVLAANDGAQAVAEYAQNKDKVEVILMDMMMPVMDGHASIRAIRKINPEVKIIAVSGLAEKDKIKNVADYTNAFLPKPYTAERLLKTINEVLNIK